MQKSNLSTHCEIAFRRMAQIPTKNRSTLVQVMAWYHQATSYYPGQCWPSFISPFGITRPQWVNPSSADHLRYHYSDVIMRTMASQITSLTIVYSTVYSSADQRKHQSSASLAFVRGIHRWPVNSPHKGLVMRKMFPFDDVIMMGPIPGQVTIIQHHDHILA